MCLSFGDLGDVLNRKNSAKTKKKFKLIYNKKEISKIIMRNLLYILGVALICKAFIEKFLKESIQ